MYEHSNVTVAKDLWSAVADGDADGLHRCLSANVIWRSFGRNPLSGEYHGVDQVIDYLARIGERSDAFNSMLETVFHNDSGAVIAHHVTATRGDSTLEMDALLVLRIHDGRIIKVSSVPADQYVNDEFWK